MTYRLIYFISNYTYPPLTFTIIQNLFLNVRLSMILIQIFIHLNLCQVYEDSDLVPRFSIQNDLLLEISFLSVHEDFIAFYQLIIIIILNEIHL